MTRIWCCERLPHENRLRRAWTFPLPPRVLPGLTFLSPNVLPPWGICTRRPSVQFPRSFGETEFLKLGHHPDSEIFISIKSQLTPGGRRKLHVRWRRWRFRICLRPLTRSCVVSFPILRIRVAIEGTVGMAWKSEYMRMKKWIYAHEEVNICAWRSEYMRMKKWIYAHESRQVTDGMTTL
jgi:hypothetical protein